MLVKLLNVIKNSRKYYHACLKFSDPRLMNSELTKRILDRFIDVGEESENYDTAQYCYTFLYNGGRAVVLKWIENNCVNNVEEIAQVILHYCPTNIS